MRQCSLRSSVGPVPVARYVNARTHNDKRRFLLSDGATLLLTVGTFADRFGHAYGQAMEPDCFCDGTEDQIQVRAAKWIQAGGQRIN